MTAGVEAIAALRETVATANRQEEVVLPSTSAEFTACEAFAVPGGNTLDHVTVILAEPVTLSDLEAEFGPARSLPRRPGGGHQRSVIFDDTMPAEGETGATVVANVEDDETVMRLVVRRDVL